MKHFSQGLQYGQTAVNKANNGHTSANKDGHTAANKAKDGHTAVEEEDVIQIISTCKHFFGYDIETGRGGLDVNISTRFIVEYYLPVFKVGRRGRWW